MALDKTHSKDDQGYLTLEQGQFVAKRFLKEVGDTPVAFFDILEDYDTSLNVALATRAGYRGKGYAKELANKGKKWFDSQNRYKQMIWGVRVDNLGSIKIAKDLGFKLDEDSYSDDKQWVNYVYKK